jgi:predicted CXXCH cytochrome family protein
VRLDLALVLLVVAEAAGLGAGGPVLAATARAESQRPAGTRVAAAGVDTFPHARHERLFTSCEACHAGVESGDSAALFPPATFCVNCHDGSLQRRVTWEPRPPRPTNLRFRHPEHPGLPCSVCHAASDTAGFMEVGRAPPARCLPCHAPEATDHLAQTSCTTCHGTVRDARALGAADLARYPRPPSHDSTWYFAHRAEATSPTCAACHAQEFCASCHVNSVRVAAIQSLPADERVAQLARSRRPVYREPGSHRDASFVREHGLLARRETSGCANCHARESCLGCHLEQERVGPVALLPRRQRGGARGVDLSGVRPPDHSPDFQLRHRTAAAGGDAVCSRCHTPSYCASCHAGASAPGFHGSGFVERHSENAYTRENDCSACHQTETFCVACHRATGQSRTGAALGRFHDAQPFWIFGHGGAARRAIESCAACHAQQDCLQCHSASGGWRVDPHGSGFDPGLADRNPALCRRCHPSGPPSR